MYLSLILALQAALAAQPAPAADVEAQQLAALRRHLAMHWCEGAAHMEMAKHLAARDTLEDRLTAFFIMRDYRRMRPADFKAAYLRVFRNVDISAAGEVSLVQALAEMPDSVAAAEKLANYYRFRDEPAKAVLPLETALRIQGDFAHAIELARVLTSAGRNEQGNQVVRAWLAAHPNAPEAHWRRILELRKTNEPAAGQLLAETLQRFPAVASLQILAAEDDVKRGDPAAAAVHMEQAAAAEPTGTAVQGSVASFFLKSHPDKLKALHYYLNVYFLDPEYHDGEFADSRIRALQWERAGDAYQRARREGARPAALLKHPDPVVVGMAVREIEDHWSPDCVEPLIETMLHDDPNNRFAATLALADHVDAGVEPRLAALLADDDLRRRGLAFYLAVKIRGLDAIPLLKSALDDESQLIRYDALTCLVEFDADESRQVLREYKASGREKVEWLVGILQSHVK